MYAGNKVAWEEVGFVSAKSNYYRRILGLILIVSLAPSMVIGGMLIAKMFSDSARDYEEMELLAMRQTIDAFEQRLLNVESAIWQFSFNQDVLHTIRTDDMVRDFQYLNRLRESCIAVMHTRPGGLTIDSIAVVNHTNHWVYDTDFGYQSLKPLPAPLRACYEDTPDSWVLQNRYVKNNFYEYMVSNKVLACSFKVVNNGVIIVKINYEDFRSAFSAFSPIADFYIVHNGKVLYDKTDENIDRSAVIYPFFDALTQDEGNIGYQQDGRGYRGAYIRSKEFGWYYVLSGEAALSRNNFFAGMTITFLVAAAIMAIVAFVAALLSRRLYKPIQKLYASLDLPSADAQPNGRKYLDEIGLIEQSVSKLMGDNHSLREQATAQREFARDLLVYRLLSGQIESTQDYELLKSYGVDLPWKNKVLIGVQFLPRCADDAEEHPELMDVYLAGTGEIARELLPRNSLVAPGMVENMLIIAVGRDHSDYRKYFSETLQKLHDSLAEYLQAEITVTMSTVFTSLDQIKTAFERLRDVVRWYGAGGGVLQPGGKEDEAQYPYHLSENMIEGIRLNDMQRIQSSMHSFLEYIHDSVLEGSHKQMFILWLVGDILRLVPDCSAYIINQALASGQEDLPQALLSLETMEQRAQWLMKRIIQPVFEALHTNNADKIQLVKQIVSFVQENLGHSAWNIESCAQELSHQVPYLRRVFKEQMGMSYSQYVNMQVMKKAQQLLCDTKLTVAEIAEELGYSNSQNFIRQFKKEYHVTPGQYRRQQCVHFE
jgi:AraC-like DNA-binding protein/HAMP domain-containing protein